MIEHLLQSGILILRAPEPEDLDVLYQWENDASLWTYGSTIQPYSRHQLREYIAQIHSQTVFQAGQLRLMVVRCDTKEVIGTIDLYEAESFHARAGVGILIDTAHQHQGFGTETLRLLKNYAFDFLGLHQIYAHIPSTNTGSIALFEKAKFERAGILKSWNRYQGKKFADILVYQCINDE